MSNEILQKIKERGYWRVIIRPEKFIKERISTLSDLQKLVAENEVRHRGWNFPHLDHEVHRGLDYIEMATTFSEINETWRLYQTGQFAFFRGLTEDWIEAEGRLPTQFSIESGTKLSIISALYQLSEIYEFATRFAQAGIFDDRVFIEVNLVKTQERELFFWPSDNRWLRRSYICNVPELPKQTEVKVLDLMARSRDYSLLHFQWLMERFGFDASQDVFKRDQEKFFEGRF